MKGFVVKTKDCVTYAALNEGSVGIVITNKEGDYRLGINGMDTQGIAYVWQSDVLCVGDSISIEYDGIDKSMVSEPLLIRDVNDSKSENQLLLDSYYKLRQELLDEGLLSE